MVITKYIEEDLVVIREGDTSVSVCLSRLTALLSDPERVKILIDGRDKDMDQEVFDSECV